MRSNCTFRFLFCFGLIGGFSQKTFSQYFYKDVIVTKQISDNYRLLKDNKVGRVVVEPADLAPDASHVTLEQEVDARRNLVLTHTKVPDATESWLKAYYDAAGRLMNTVDSSAEVVTSSAYEYDNNGRLIKIFSRSVPVNDPAETEMHFWSYNANGQPVSMLKVKDSGDTTKISFVPDDKGNPGEEKAVRNKIALPSIYYYFDAQNRLTDVAKYNQKADRILPQYVFEYNEGGQISQMIVVPSGSSDYQTWRYLYKPNGLKEKDLCYSKQKQLVATINYVYK